ncbi:MAG: hypothetical protein LBV52_02465 [Spirochaetaceae bacterium]|nr:hypothetical protein [Spirochaetaceae bacterium]
MNNIYIWLFFHIGLIAALVVSLFLIGKVNINTNLFDILPDTKNLKIVASADKILREKSGKQVLILSASKNFDNAKQSAATLYESLLKTDGLFENLSFYVDENTIGQFQKYFFDNRFLLLNEETGSILQNGGAEEFAANALSQFFSPFTFYMPDKIASDPFMLANTEMTALLSSGLLSSGSMSPHDGVLACNYEGLWFVLLRGTISSSDIADGNKKKLNAAPLIYALCNQIKTTETEFIFSGVPFHSYESSTSAQKEISLISSISMALIIILFIVVFRSIAPALFSASAVFLSLIIALASTLLIFREIHILTFVFGTTLIGACVDYSIHYFVHSRAEVGSAVINKIWRGLAISFLSTEVCFALLLFAPFMLLRQFAVFSMAGLLSSFLTVVCVFPHLKHRVQNNMTQNTIQDTTMIEVFDNDSKTKPAQCGQRLIKFNSAYPILIIIILCSVLLSVNHKNIRIDNNIANLYSPKGKLLADEKKVALAMNTGASSCYFIVSANSAEELLVNEENFCRLLNKEIENGTLKNYMATSILKPSIQAQNQSYEAASRLLPYVPNQIAALDLPANDAIFYTEEFEAAKNMRLSPEGELPDSMQNIISNLWLGNINGKYFSCILPLNIQKESVLSDLAYRSDSVVFVNKVKDINAGLNTLTRIMFILFAAAYIIICILVRLFYSKKKALHICAVPLFLCLVTLTVFACLNIPLGFFSATGLVLVFGLGLDYIFYITESKKDNSLRAEQKETLLGIVLSFATTILSFGSLVLSNFAPVHIFALTVSVGLSSAFVISMLIAMKRHSA